MAYATSGWRCLFSSAECSLLAVALAASLQYMDAVQLLFEQHGIILLGLRLNLDELEENQR